MPIPNSSLELLENRIAPAVVVAYGDFDGDGVEHDLRITGGAGKERVLIEDSSLGTKLFIDINGNGSFTDPGDTNGAAAGFAVNQFEINLGGGNDILTVRLVGNYTSAASKSFFVNLGSGNNEFHFIAKNGST